MTLSKDSLRYEARRHRDRIDAADEPVDDLPEIFCDALKPSPDQLVAFYWPKEREFDPRGLMFYLMERGYNCALPVIEQGSRILKFARWRDGDGLVPGPFGVMQPAQTQWVEPDIVIVPLLAFDLRGNRLGYGGGYYDATLKDLRARKHITAAGIGYAQQAVLYSLPAEDHDERLDWVITPLQAHRYTG